MQRSLGIQPSELRDRIAAAAKTDPAMNAAYDRWINPLAKPAGITKQEKEIEQLQRRNALERAKHDRSWTGFAAKLRANPAEMKNLQPTTSTTTDSKLFHLWELLNHTADADRRYALDSVAPLEPMIGKDAAEGFRLGLIAHWRAWTPWLQSARKDSELNQSRSFDCMGLAGVSLEAKDNPGPRRLTMYLATLDCATSNPSFSSSP